MAIDPAVLKLAASKGLSLISDEDKRNNIILFITIIISIFLVIVIIPIYILSNPVDTFKNLFSDEEISILQEVKEMYKIDYGMGNITIKSKLGFPLEKIDSVVITAEYGMYDPWNNGNVTKHTGIDLSGVHRDNVLAVEKGMVTFAGIQNRLWKLYRVKTYNRWN